MQAPSFQEEDFPALYGAADQLSNATQKNYLLLIKAFLVLLIIAAGLSAYSLNNTLIKILSAFVYTLVLALTIITYMTNLNKRWYNSRAIAESIKTITWRYIMCAEPYPISLKEDEANEAFIKDLRLLYGQNSDIVKYMPSTHIGSENITDGMRAVRKVSFKSRFALYVKLRIDDQLGWYKKKTGFNDSRARLWFAVLVILLSASIFLIISSVAWTSEIALPIEIFSTAVACSFTWIQIKRYRDLSAAYKLTATEISFIKSLSKKVNSENAFSRFVTDAENAFSREHTQWAARRDHLN